MIGAGACGDVADDVFDGEDEWCDVTADHHICGLPDEHLAQQAHECRNCGVTW